MVIQKNIVLANYTSWSIGGVADHFCLPESLEDMKTAMKWAQTQGHAISILGGGTNVLISDSGIRGLTICTRKFSGYSIIEQDCDFIRMECLSGTSKSELLKIFLKKQSPAALFLAGLPGDIGGGVVMNAGVSEEIEPREFKDIVEWIEVLKPDGQIVRYLNSQINWSYRHSDGWQPGIIVKVRIRYSKLSHTDILEKVKIANKNRLQKQPLDWPNCGSVFINPPGYKAAQLIDSCGLKGFQIGGAQISIKHANFIINKGNATALDVDGVIKHVRQTVKKQKNVDLQTEVIRMGEFVVVNS